MNIKGSMRILKEKGYKQTDKRRDIIQIFADTQGYHTAREVLDQLSDHYNGLSFDTIYRNLSLFVDLGLLEETELNGEKHYQLKCCFHHHLHHMICLKCGLTRPVEDCPMDQIKPADGFKITGHKFEVYGVCVQCQ